MSLDLSGLTRIRPVDAEEQEPLGIEDVVDLPATDVLEASVANWRRLVEAAEQTSSRMRLQSATSRLRLAQRDLSFGRWRDRYLRERRPPMCQPWCLGRGWRRVNEAVPVGSEDGSDVAVENRPEYCPCEDGVAAAARHDARRQEAQAAAAQRRAAAIWESADIPPKLARYSLESYLLRDDARPAVVDKLRRWQCAATVEGYPCWLLLWGDVGTCKTGLAVSLLLDALAAGQSGLYVLASDTFDQLSATYGRREKGEPDETEVMASLVGLDLLVLDDVGTGSVTLWRDEKLLKLIDKRDTHARRTIVTTNLSPAELEAHIGKRSFDRLRGNTEAADESFVIELTGESRRGVTA